MPAPIDLLYRMTDRDRAFPHWGPTTGNLNHTEVLGGVMFSTLAEWDDALRAPLGTMLFVTNLVAFARPAPTETATRLSVHILNRNTLALRTDLLNARVAAVPNPEDLTLQSQFDIAISLEREFLSVTGEFSLGPNSTVSLHWAGYIMPAGSIGFN